MDIFLLLAIFLDLGRKADRKVRGDPLLFAPGARALTPDQQDGVCGGGGKTATVAEEHCFFQTLCRQAGKRRFTQNVQPQKNCGLLWHYR